MSTESNYCQKIEYACPEVLIRSLFRNSAKRMQQKHKSPEAARKQFVSAVMKEFTSPDVDENAFEESNENKQSGSLFENLRDQVSLAANRTESSVDLWWDDRRNKKPHLFFMEDAYAAGILIFNMLVAPRVRALLQRNPRNKTSKNTNLAHQLVVASTIGKWFRGRDTDEILQAVAKDFFANSPVTDVSAFKLMEHRRDSPIMRNKLNNWHYAKPDANVILNHLMREQYKAPQKLLSGIQLILVDLVRNLVNTKPAAHPRRRSLKEKCRHTGELLVKHYQRFSRNLAATKGSLSPQKKRAETYELLRRTTQPTDITRSDSTQFAFSREDLWQNLEINSKSATVPTYMPELTPAEKQYVLSEDVPKCMLELTSTADASVLAWNTPPSDFHTLAATFDLPKLQMRIKEWGILITPLPDTSVLAHNNREELPDDLSLAAHNIVLRHFIDKLIRKAGATADISQTPTKKTQTFVKRLSYGDVHVACRAAFLARDAWFFVKNRNNELPPNQKFSFDPQQHATKLHVAVAEWFLVLTAAWVRCEHAVFGKSRGSAEILKQVVNITNFPSSAAITPRAVTRITQVMLLMKPKTMLEQSLYVATQRELSVAETRDLQWGLKGVDYFKREFIRTGIELQYLTLACLTFAQSWSESKGALAKVVANILLYSATKGNVLLLGERPEATALEKEIETALVEITETYEFIREAQKIALL